VERVLLDVAVTTVMDAGADRLQAHAVPGGLLEGILAVETADQSAGDPEYPAIIIQQGPITPVNQTSMTIEWDFLLRAVAIVNDYDPVAGRNKARYWAARAFNALLTDPSSGAFVSALPGALMVRAAPFEPPVPGAIPETHQARSAVMTRIKTTF
jgi:hypothetical protein